MDKFTEQLDTLIYDSIIAGEESNEEVVEQIKELLTPKLQWKSEEITNDGGDNLLYTIHYILNYDTETTIKVYEYTDGTNCVDWGNSTLFWGTVDECKQFCSDKILEDFLKLCQ